MSPIRRNLISIMLLAIWQALVANKLAVKHGANINSEYKFHTDMVI